MWLLIKLKIKKIQNLRILFKNLLGFDYEVSKIIMINSKVELVYSLIFKLYLWMFIL